VSTGFLEDTPYGGPSQKIKTRKVGKKAEFINTYGRKF
jgi:hypothetical protein